MKSADGELIPPARFIPAAERYNIMPAIDRWVVNAGFAGLARCLADRQGTDNPLLSINLSGLSLRSPGFVCHVQDCLDKHHVNPDYVCFEITETVAVADIAQASRFIEELRKLGCRFALDDFGIGFSSFAYLSELAVDFIKIDGSFVRKLSVGKVNSAIVRSIVDIGKAAGMSTIAEHVEDQSLIEKLAELGVDYAQGYLIDHPAVFDKQATVTAP
jgi:EAL domain-containing protein (putative c-di-GMP-specific phosphodiesterase class I)